MRESLGLTKPKGEVKVKACISKLRWDWFSLLYQASLARP